MKIAIEGCAHGELENIYDTIQLLEETESIKINLLICCGDFQSSRNEADLLCMAVPQKYAKICSFYKYYTGEKKAPILTIFIGGNHESSNYLQELPYGGWVASNIYYLGYAGVINIGGIRIGGLSGIYKSRDYMKGHFEKVPYNEDTKRSVYHIRNLEIFRLKQLSGRLHIFLSHDWPNGIYNFGNTQQLLKKKPFFRDEIESGQLGSKPYEELLHQLKPSYWFSAHLHCKFAALVPHEDKSVTKFLALDKCLPKRKFLQVVNIPHDEESKIDLSYDLEWLAILFLTNHLLSVRNTTTYMPGPGGNERYNFTPSEEDKQHVLSRFNNDLRIPKNFEISAPPYNAQSPKKVSKQPEAKLNPQTVLLCETLGITDPVCLISEADGTISNLSLELSVSDSFINDTFDTSTSSLSQSSTPVKQLGSQSSTPVKKLGGLSLPKPKLDVSDVENDAASDAGKEKESDSTIQTVNEEVPVVNSEKDVCSDASPNPKKFKRRNAELYNDAVVNN
ncbi:hypothetical protein NQ315_006339 [Exocentrus adspersus]|uniref:Lariat debranching enzyme C-terminal domain-containing protein n=1 Tax=Exocentrus adspersus TaxID=1586481 RepID=A0AAV8VZV1_9CUCU|nr:hypothetical protein NQ315_006339 [Exocentrus adspersus]